MGLFNNFLSKKTPPKSLYEIKINDINGVPLELTQLKGKKILFVNVASKCGFTEQYKSLQKLYDDYSNVLTVVGVPCNQFGAQEPGTNKEIKEFCSLNYGVSFPITEKLLVKGSDKHELYEWLTDKKLNGNKSSSVKWNFQKYLIDEEGNLLDYFYSITTPDSGKITKYLK